MPDPYTIREMLDVFLGVFLLGGILLLIVAAFTLL